MFPRSATREEVERLLETRLGIVIAIILHTHNPLRYKFFQACIGVEMWRQGASHTVFNVLNRLGISQGVVASRKNVDTLCSSYDAKIEVVKSSIEAKTVDTSFSVCYDNVQFQPHKKHTSKQQAGQFTLRALCFGVLHRTPSLHLRDGTTSLAVDLAPHVFLPQYSEWCELKKRMTVIVRRILVRHIPAFAEMKVNANARIPHVLSHVMDMKSEVVNLGLLDADPSSTAGTVQIMTQLSKYVPEVNGELLHIPCNGDGLSVERMTHAKRARSRAVRHARLLGLEETPQEFHKEALLLQVKHKTKIFSLNHKHKNWR